MKCPKCQATLAHETYEGVQIDRCASCKGTWLDEGELIAILDVKEEKFSSDLIEETIQTAFAGIPAAEHASVELCPKCSKRMQAVNYVADSGIVIDRCADSHGVWLDGKEIERIQAHREYWVAKSAENRGEWLALVRSVEESERGKDAEELKRALKKGPISFLVTTLVKKIAGV